MPILSKARTMLAAMRPGQWVKNALVAAPLFFAWGDPGQGLGSKAALAAAAAEALTAAVEATGSRLPEMLVNSGERMKKYLEENKTLHKVEDVDEAPFVAFEAEFTKLHDYIAGL